MVVIACTANKVRITSRRFRLAARIVALLTYSSLDVVADEPPLIQLASHVVTGPTFNHGMSVPTADRVASPSATAVNTRRTQ
jgi:hypothetical protein